MSRTDDAVHGHPVTGQVPMRVGDGVTDRHLLGADGCSDEVPPREDKHVFRRAGEGSPSTSTRSVV